MTDSLAVRPVATVTDTVPELHRVEEMIHLGDQHFRMAIQGMTCPSCERHVIHALTQAGALEVTASYRRREARFRYNADADRKPLVEAVKEAGYRPGTVEVVSAIG